MKTKITLIVLIIFLFFSLLLNVLTIVPYWDDVMCKFMPNEERLYFTADTNDSLVIGRIVENAFEMDGKLYYQRREYHGLLQDAKNFWKSISYPPAHRFNNESWPSFNMGYLYAGLSYYAMKHKDEVSIRHRLEEKAALYIQNRYQYVGKLDDINKAPFAILFINLYRMTGDEQYMEMASLMYRELLALREKGNVIPYFPNTDFYFTDGVGMIVPFLMEYYEITKDSLAKRVAEDNFMNAYHYAVDKETGVPCHGYDSHSGIKMGGQIGDVALDGIC